MNVKEPPLLQEHCIYDLCALHDMASGNDGFIISLVKIFLETIPPNSKEMVEAAQKGNWDMVSKLAHKLKSTIDMMRMETIKQEIRTIEWDAKNHVNKESLLKLVTIVDKTIMIAASQLREEFDLP
jgi:dihydrodipicolinate synthase/N-acetylneuraminate lyase